MKALFTRLKWQQAELSQKLLAIEQQLENMAQKMDAIHQEIASSSSVPALIRPEIEMARVNFITQQQQHQDELTIRKTTLLSEHAQLELQQTRLNIELKRLEKHQEARQKNQQRQSLLTQQNNLDEWTLQRRGVK